MGRSFIHSQQFVTYITSRMSNQRQSLAVTEPRGALGVRTPSGGTYPPPLFENMGRVISPNLQTRAYGARERPPVSPDYRVPPHLQTPGSVTGR